MPVRRCVVFPLFVRTLAMGRTAAVLVVTDTHDPAPILYWSVKLMLATAFASFCAPNRSRNAVSSPISDPGPQ